MNSTIELTKKLPVTLQSQAIVIQVLDEQMKARKVTLSFDNDNWFSLAPWFIEMKEKLHKGVLNTIRQDENIIASKSDGYYLKNGIYVNIANWQTQVKRDGEWQPLYKEKTIE